jgi:hypothetical protein
LRKETSLMSRKQPTCAAAREIDHSGFPVRWPKSPP